MDRDKWRFLPQKPPWYLWLAAGAIILGSILMSAGKINGTGQHQAGQQAASQARPVDQDRAATELMATAREMADQLQETLTKIAGAGRVSVTVSLQSSPLKEFATNTKTTKHSVEEKDQGGGTRVTTDSNEDATLVMARNGQGSGGEAPVVSRESKPEVQGVVVVAEGAGDALVKLRLSQAVETLWGLAPHQVQVLPMDPGGNPK
ncbi:MAG: stage sporulation protein [Moorella sp. (in: firmicutes)]|nr:stage sporulation protein [Moorella sp. (in: firmicutes)]